MNRLLNEIAYRGFCTWMALVTVWAYGIQSPLSWGLIGLATAVDAAALVLPRKCFEECRFSVPITDLAAGVAIVVLILIMLAAPFLQIFCSPVSIDWMSDTFKIIAYQLEPFGGQCAASYGFATALLLYVYPFFIFSFVIILRIASLFAEIRVLGSRILPRMVRLESARPGVIWGLSLIFACVHVFPTLSFDPDGRARVVAPPINMASMILVAAFMICGFFIVNAVFVLWHEKRWGLKQ